MTVYLHTFVTSILIFFVTSSFATFPIILFQYRKNGFFQLKKAFDLFTFIFYIQTVLLLVILPLPEWPQKLDPNYRLATHINWIPFSFVGNILQHAKPLSIKTIIESSDFYTTVFNIAMFVPMGVYVRNLWSFSFKKTLIVAFLCSLFCEVSQLTGLFFLYPQPYRYFDVNDLMMNTLGALLGYGIAHWMAFLFVSSAQEKARRIEINHSEISMFPQYLMLLLGLFIYRLLVGIFYNFMILTIYFINANQFAEFPLNETTKSIVEWIVQIGVFVWIFLCVPYFSVLNQTIDMKLLKYAAKIKTKKKLLIRNLLLYGVFLINGIAWLGHVYYIGLIIFRKKRTWLDQKTNVEYYKEHTHKKQRS